MTNQIAERLLAGEKVLRYREGGNSMLPILKSRQPVDLSPVTDLIQLSKGSIVFVKVNGRYVTHKISAIKGKQYQISNNKGWVNGWVTRDKIFGVVTRIHDE